MSLALLIDFGSTYTKVTAVDLETDRSIGRAQAPSTVDTDVLQGLLRAMELLKARVNLDNVSLKLASSKRCRRSAHGRRRPHCPADLGSRQPGGSWRRRQGDRRSTGH